MQILINLTPASSMFLQCPVIVTYCFNVFFCCFNVFSSDNCLRFVFSSSAIVQIRLAKQNGKYLRQLHR